MFGFRFATFGASLLLTVVACAAQTPTAVAPQAPTPPAQPAALTPIQSGTAAAHPLQSADLEAFFDGIFPLQLERSDIAGASVLVMKDGNILLQKGYGYADVKTKRAVDPNSTIFRLASISKLFTWISIMQLEERGKVDLDTDINLYLDFQIKPAFNKPVTLRNLMTHTGGFEEVINDIIVVDPKKAVSLRDHLIQNQPRRMYPPGQIPAYSNYGVGLGSYIVQRVSGQPFEQYVQDHIFTPLAMNHSSFYQPLQKSLVAFPSLGYRSSTLKPPVGFETLNPVGAGGLSSTASDMGRFGHALLNGGELDGNRILKPETLALMWTPQFQANKQLPPLCMGFYQDWRNNLRWIGHEGDLIAFHSLFFVEPQQNIVLFVSYNSAEGGGKPRPEIIDFFSDRYFPGAPIPTFLKTPGSQLHAITGAYVATRRADSTKLRLESLFSQTRASVDKDAVLHLSNFEDLRGHPIKWKLISSDLWQEVDGQQKIFAIRDSHNKVTRIALDFPGVQLQRVPWYEDNRLVLPALFTSIGILALVVFTSFIRVMRRIFFRSRPRLEPRPETIWLTAGPRIAAFAWVLLFAAIAIFLISSGNDTLPPTPAWFKWFVLMNWATGLAIFLSLFPVLSAFRIWRRDSLRWITRVKFSLVGAACLILCWFAIHWNVIGPAHRI